MPLDSRVQQQVARKVEIYEGRVGHFYLDSIGKVTVGVGHLIPDRNAVAHIDMVKITPGQPSVQASTGEKLDEYDRVSAEPAGYRASWYRRVTQLQMLDADITRLRDRHIHRFYRELCGIYSRARGYPNDFDTLPLPVQMALFDLIFNLGATKLVNVFRRLDVAIRASDWRQAATESLRPQVSNARNHYVHQLFMTAAGATVACVPTC